MSDSDPIRRRPSDADVERACAFLPLVAKGAFKVLLSPFLRPRDGEENEIWIHAVRPDAETPPGFCEVWPNTSLDEGVFASVSISLAPITAADALDADIEGLPAISVGGILFSVSVRAWANPPSCTVGIKIGRGRAIVLYTDEEDSSFAPWATDDPPFLVPDHLRSIRQDEAELVLGWIRLPTASELLAHSSSKKNSGAQP